MNKEFEQQYKDYVNAQAPDLWDRIEANLKDKDNAKKGKAFVGKKRTFSIFVSAAAAVLLCLFIPAVLRDTKSEENASADMENYTASAEYEEAEMNQENSASADIDQDMNVNESADASQNMDISESAGQTAENIRQMTVYIQEIKETGQDSEYTYLYRAKVVAAAGNPELEGEELYFYTGKKTDITLGEMPEIGEEYNVDLIRMQDKKIFFAEKINFTP